MKKQIEYGRRKKLIKKTVKLESEIYVYGWGFGKIIQPIKYGRKHGVTKT